MSVSVVSPSRSLRELVERQLELRQRSRASLVLQRLIGIVLQCAEMLSRRAALLDRQKQRTVWAGESGTRRLRVPAQSPVASVIAVGCASARPRELWNVPGLEFVHDERLNRKQRAH